MRYSILGFNQEKAVEAKLDLTDILILDYIIRANGNPKMHHILDDSDISYVWLSHDKIQEDLPILDMTEGTLRNKLTDLKQRGFINSKQVTKTSGRGSKAYYSVTEYTIELTTSLENDVVSRPHHSEMTSDNKLLSDNNIEKDIITINSNNTDFIGKVKSSKKRSLYDKCYEHVIAFTNNIGLQDALTEYLKIRLQMKDKPLYEGTWKGMLNKLSKMDNQIEVVNTSIERGWASFFEQKSYRKGKEVFGEDDSIVSEKGEFESSGETY